MRDGGHVFDHGDLQAGGLQRTDRGFTAGTGALDHHVHKLEAVVEGRLRSGLGSHLSGERSGLLVSAEAHAAGGSPGQGAAVGIGDGDDGVIERRLDVRHAALDKLPLAALAGRLLQLRFRPRFQHIHRLG